MYEVPIKNYQRRIGGKTSIMKKSCVRTLFGQNIRNADLMYAEIGGRIYPTEERGLYSTVAAYRNLGYNVVFAEQPEMDFNLKVKRLFSVGPTHNYHTVVWFKYIIGLNGHPEIWTYYCKISKMAIYKYKNAIPLDQVEMGQMLNFPLRIFENAEFITRYSGNFGQRGVKIQRPEWNDALDVVLLPDEIFQIVPEFMKMYRLSSGRDADLPAIVKCSEWTYVHRSSQEIFSDFERNFDNLFDYNFPIFGDLNLHSLINSAEIKADRLVGAVARLGRGRDSPKKDYLVEGFYLAHMIASRLDDKEVLYDSSLYYQGGRSKINLDKTTGDILKGRPVWIANFVSELLLSHLTDKFINHFKTSSVDNPIYLGKNLDRNGFKKLTSRVISPDRICYHGDYSGWDATIPLTLIRCAFALLRSLFPQGVKWDLFWLFIYSGLSRHPLIINGGYLISFKRGMPSGHKLTSTVNSLVNLFLMNEHINQSNTYESLLTIKKEINETPIGMGVLGDDFFVCSFHPSADMLVDSMGFVSTYVAAKFCMDLDPPYIGPFAVENPDLGGFEFLRTRFTRDLEPTLTSQELVKRYLLPERKGSSLNPDRKIPALEYPPQHTTGIITYSNLVGSSLRRKYTHEQLIRMSLLSSYQESTERVWYTDKKLVRPPSAKTWVYNYVNRKIGSRSYRGLDKVKFFDLLHATFGYSKMDNWLDAAFCSRGLVSSYLDAGYYIPISYITFYQDFLPLD